MKKICEMTLNEYIEKRRHELKALAWKHYEDELRELDNIGIIRTNYSQNKTNRKNFQLWLSYLKNVGMEKAINEINSKSNDIEYIEGLQYVIDWLNSNELIIKDHKVTPVNILEDEIPF